MYILIKMSYDVLKVRDWPKKCDFYKKKYGLYPESTGYIEQNFEKR